MYEFEIFYLTFFRILSFSTQWRSFTRFPHKTKLFPGISFQNGFSIWNNEVMATNLCYFPANIYLKSEMEILKKVVKKCDVIPVSLLLTLNIFVVFF